MITEAVTRRAARRVVSWSVVVVLVFVTVLFLCSQAITAMVALVSGPIKVSGWGEMNTTFSMFAALLGVLLATVRFPQHITHGRTRREFVAHLALGVVVVAVVLGVAGAGAFALESVVYRLVGWPHELSSPGGLYTEANQYSLVALESWLTTPTWIAVGAFVGAGFYRSPLLGCAVLPVGGALVAVVELAATSRGATSSLVDTLGGPFYVGEFPVPMVLACLATFLLALALTWAVMRDMPVRSRQ